MRKCFAVEVFDADGRSVGYHYIFATSIADAIKTVRADYRTKNYSYIGRRDS